MKKLFVTVCVFLLIIFNGLFCPAEIYDLDKKLDSKQKEQLLKDIIIRKPFLDFASDLKLKKNSIGKFFNRRIYKMLMGNDILGYDFDGGFVFDSDRISITEIKTPGIISKYRKKFIRLLRNELISRKIRVVKNSHIEIGVALLDVEPEQTLKSLPGALVELFFKNKKLGKSFYYRFGTGKRSGLNGAFSDIWQIIFSTLESFEK